MRWGSSAAWSLVSQFRSWVVRSPRSLWLVIVVLAGWCGITVASQLAAARNERERWGRPVMVWVADRSIVAGQPLTVAERWYPEPVVPVGALTSPPGTEVAAHELDAGEVITVADITAPGPAALVRPGWVALAVPVDGGDPAGSLASGSFAPGSFVTVFTDGMTIANGEVIASSTDSVLVAVPHEDGAAVSHAVVNGRAILGLTAVPRR